MQSINYPPLISKFILPFFTVAIFYCYWIYNAIFRHEYLFSEQTYLCRGIVLIMASILFYAILKFAYTKIKNSYIANFFCLLGKFTLGIYMTNSLIIFALINYNFLPRTDEWFILFIYSVLVTVTSYTITIFIKKSKALKIYLLGER